VGAPSIHAAQRLTESHIANVVSCSASRLSAIRVRPPPDPCQTPARPIPDIHACCKAPDSIPGTSEFGIEPEFRSPEWNPAAPHHARDYSTCLRFGPLSLRLAGVKSANPREHEGENPLPGAVSSGFRPRPQALISRAMVDRSRTAITYRYECWRALSRRRHRGGGHDFPALDRRALLPRGAACQGPGRRRRQFGADPDALGGVARRGVRLARSQGGGAFGRSGGPAASC
jgi:hypothetical protein